jgi:nucleoside-diphosphate-sugar epimerase
LEELDPASIGFVNPIFYEFSWHGVFGTERNDPTQLTINLPLLIGSVNFAKGANASHWIGIGSQAEYGNLDKRISESEPCQPTTLYGNAKLFSSQITSMLCQELGMQHSWLRLFSVYGPDDNHEWLIQYLIRKMLANEEIDVTKGEQKWDYLYVDDISSLLMLLAGRQGIGITNLGSGSSIAVRDIIEKLKKITNSRSEIHFGAIPYRPDQVMLMEADITRLKSLTGWLPSTSIDVGLTKTVEYHNRNLHFYT